MLLVIIANFNLVEHYRTFAFVALNSENNISPNVL